MKPACAPQTNAQSSPNSAGSPKRPAGLVRRRSRTTSSTVRPLVFAWMAMVERNRSVSKGPGRRLLIVTLWATVLRASPATNPVSPARAPFESPRMSIGCFTALDVMLTMRPKRRAIMPSTVALMRRIGVIMFASTARIHVSRSQSRKSPGGGPPALLTRMSGAGHAVRSEARRRERLPDRLSLGSAHGGERRAHVRGGQAAQQHQRRLHAVVHVHEWRGIEDLHQRIQTVVDAPRTVHVSLLAQLK